jgi:hypothetical protein
MRDELGSITTKNDSYLIAKPAKVVIKSRQITKPVIKRSGSMNRAGNY